MSEYLRRPTTQRVTEDAQVTPLELFFDLVFVYALTQTTALMASNVSVEGLARGFVVLALVWWCWVGYSWLGNQAQADEGIVRVAFIVVMMAMFVLALTIPETWGDLPGGLEAPVVFALCYLVIRVAHLGLYWIAAAGDTGLRRTLRLFAATALGSSAVLLAGASWPEQWRLPLWTVALAVDLGGTIAIGASGWRINAPGHFAERHGLIIIVALGESIVAIGVGVTSLPISMPVIVASALGIAVSGALWWIYFDTASLLAEHRLADADDVDQVALGRDAFSYLHLPMVLGVVILSVGLKRTLSYAGGEEDHQWTDSITGLGGATVPLGVAVFLAGHLASRARCRLSLPPGDVAGIVVLVALAVGGPHLPAFLTLAAAVAVLTVLVVVELWRDSGERYEIRHA